MKMKICITIIMILSILFSGCVKFEEETTTPVEVVQKETVETNEPLEEPKEEKTEVFEYSSKKLQTSNGERNIIYTLNENQVEVSGFIPEKNGKYILLLFVETNTQQEAVEVIDGKFNISAPIPESESDLTLNLFWGEAQYGDFESIVHDFVKIEKLEGAWHFKKSPVLEENVNAYYKEKKEKENLKSTRYIQTDDEEIISLSNEITKDAKDDYDKVLKIHNWVAENIYYDYEALASGNFENADAVSVLNSKRAVCEGYANLFAALTRAQNIPCAVKSGYALGVGIEKVWTEKALQEESNHAWNEVFVNGRWIIVDATWDSQNKIENGEMIKGKEVNHVYFDADIVFFSLSHRYIEN